jgi:predicted SAM-dependent methyltransferase
MLVNHYIRAAAAADRLPPSGGVLDAIALPIKAVADDIYADLVAAAAVLTDPAERMHAEHALKALPRAVTDHVRLRDALTTASTFDSITIAPERLDDIRRRFADADNQLERLRYTLIHLNAL